MRVSRLERSQVEPESQQIYDLYLRERGHVPRMFRTAAHRPEIFRTMIAHLRAVMNTGTVPARLKELVIVRTSQLNRCQYCLSAHTASALQQGWTPAHIAALSDFERHDGFNAAEKAALRFTERMNLDSNAMTDAGYAELRRHFDEGQVVELAAVIGLFIYFNHFNNILHMDG